MINLGTDSPWGFDYSFNIMVDFCIWVLELDGLRVPPFDQHPEGDGMLRARGLTAEHWRSWLTRVVLLQDRRLNWRVENLQASVEEKLAAFETMNSLRDRQVERSDLRSSLENQLIWQHQQFQHAAAQIVGRFSREDGPLELWVGSKAVGELLRELWQGYLPVLNQRDSHQRRQAEQTETMDKLWQDLQIYRTRLHPLQIYQVGYPEPVEYLIPPVSIILSIANGLPGSDTFCKCVLHGAESLAATNRLNSES